MNSRVLTYVGLLATLSAPVWANGSALGTGRDQLKNGQYAEAEATFRQLVAEKPDDPSLLLALGQAAVGARDFGTAQQCLNQALSLKPDWTEATYWLGVTFEQSGQLGEAAAAYRKVLALSHGHEAATQGLRRLAAPATAEDDPRHHAVALQVEGGLTVDRGQVRVESPRIHDYTFSDAPADWVLESGDWRVRSRWSCTPDWNFMGGESPLAAVIWNKREFLGDLTVETYISNKMNVLGEGGYRNTSDFNITICGDGRNVSSGYSFIVGGWSDSYTAIMKGTKVLAQTNDPGLKPVTLLDGQPGTWAWHRRWWEVRAVKRGQSLYLFFDNKLALQAQDPDPLPGGRVALWTFDNGILIPRVRVYYEAERPASERSLPPYALDLAEATPPPAVPALTFASDSHPSVQCRFDHDLGGWTRRDGDHGAFLALDAPGPDGHGGCLRLVNQNSGGTFGATAVAGPFDAVKLNRLEFDYRVPENVKTNLQLTAHGTRYEILFTAPEYPSDRALRLAALPGVMTDSKWHHARLDLLGCLRRYFPDAPSIEVTDVWFGLDTTRDYILAGFGGNPALAEYRLANFALLGAGPADGQVKLAATPPAQTAAPAAGAAAPAAVAPAAYEYAVDRAPLSEPDGATKTADGVIPLKGLADGIHYLHARAVAADGTKGPLYHQELLVDTSPPAVAGISPKPGATAAPEEIDVVLADKGAGINPASIALAVNDHELKAAAPGVAYDPVTSTIRVRPGEAGLSFEPGQEVHVALAHAVDWRGNALAKPESWQYTFDRKLDTEPPTVPVAALPRPYLCLDTFEDGLDEWHAYASSLPATLTVDDTTAASGKCSLRVYNPKSAGPMGALARTEAFDAGVYRIVSFDYKLRPEVRVDLYAIVNGVGYSIQFTSKTSPNKIGAIENVQADDKWHHAEVNLYDLLRAALPTSPGYIVSGLMFYNASGYGNIQHQYFNLDNFALAPVSAAPAGSAVKVATGDASGIAGLSWVVDTTPITEPPAVLTTKVAELLLPEVAGQAWLHVRAEDRAGNWSGASHQRLLVDTQPPTATPISPANGAVTAVSQVALGLTDTGLAGVDPRSVRLEVGGVPYTVDNSGLVYHSESGQLLWNCEQTSPAPVVFTNGQSVPVRLLAAADYAGNPVSSLPAWTWTMDYSKDATPPVIASLTCPTHATLSLQTFDAGTEQVQRYGDGSSAQVALDASSPDGAGSSVKLTQLTAGGNMAVYLTTTPYSTATYPYLSFDYRLPAATTVDLFIVFYGETLVVKMTDNAGGYSDSIPIQADGQWHHCTYNLHALISQRATQRGLGAYYTVSYLGLSHRSGTLAAGAEMNLDNVMVSAAGPNAATFSWSATDTTGVAGYSYVLDQKADTAPAATLGGAAVSASFPNLPTGVSYFHLRASDGAGNWGPTRTWAALVQ